MSKRSLLCAEENDCVVLGGGGHCVTYQPGKNEVKDLNSLTVTISFQQFSPVKALTVVFQSGGKVVRLWSSCHSWRHTGARELCGCVIKVVFSSFEAKNVNVNLQSFHLELLQHLTESIGSGYNGALLLCGAFTEQTSTLVDGSIIKQVESQNINTLQSGMTSTYYWIVNSVSGFGKSVSLYLVSSEIRVVHHCVIPSGWSFYLITHTQKKSWII